MPGYEKQTLQAANPIARFAHTRRYVASLTFTDVNAAPGAALLDYGCGEGHFLDLLAGRRPDLALTGYDPYSRHDGGSYRKVDDLTDVPAGSVDVLTCFETLEHLDEAETQAFLQETRRLLGTGGKLVVSVPIIGGPPLLLKEANRVVVFRRRSDYRARELLAGAFLGRPASRAPSIKESHKGFDWRAIEGTVAAGGFAGDGLVFSPFPALPWWLNSQVFSVFTRAD